MSELISIEAVAGKIFFIHGVKVMLDRNLAELYGVETRGAKSSCPAKYQAFPQKILCLL